MKQKFEVSVIISSINRVEEIKNCIYSVFQQSFLPKEIIIVDQSKPQYSYDELVQDNTSKVEVVHLNSAPGLCKAINLGTSKAKGNLILCLDDDVVLDIDYIKEIVRIFEECNDNKLGGVTGFVKNPNGNHNTFLKKIGNFFFGCFFMIRSGDGNFQLSGWPTIPIHDRVSRTEVMPGNNFTVKKEVFSKYKVDERLDEFYEKNGTKKIVAAYLFDNDFSYRVSKEYHLIYNPNAKIFHNLSRRFSKNHVYIYNRKTIVDSYYVLHKNFDVNIKRKIAFWLSVLGLFFVTLASKNYVMSGFKGILDGITDCLTRKGNARFVHS